MARIRSLKPECFKDEDLATLPYEARLLYMGLWCYADREGRLEDRPKYLKIEIFPYDNVNIEKFLNLLANPNIPDRPEKVFIYRYIIDDRKYIYIPEFLKHQSPHNTEKESCLPPFNSEITVKEPLENNGTQDAHISLSDPISKSLSKSKEKEKLILGDLKNVKLTQNELDNLNNKFGKEITEKAIQYLSNYKKDKKYKNSDDNLTIQRWVIDAIIEKQNKPKPTKPAKQDSPYEKCPRCGKELRKGYEYINIGGQKCCEYCPEAREQAKKDYEKLGGLVAGIGKGINA